MGKELLLEMAKERWKGENTYLKPQIVVGWKAE
jgi:hypothetical protein